MAVIKMAHATYETCVLDLYPKFQRNSLDVCRVVLRARQALRPESLSNADLDEMFADFYRLGMDNAQNFAGLQYGIAIRDKNFCGAEKLVDKSRLSKEDNNIFQEPDIEALGRIRDFNWCVGREI